MTSLTEVINQDSGLEVREVAENNNQVAEKVFQSRKPKGKVTIEMIKELKNIITKNNQLATQQYIGYENVKNIEGEYFLFRAKNDIKPLKKYLETNEVTLNTIVNWLETVVSLFQKAKNAGLNWQGVLPESLWVGVNGKIFIVDPKVTKKIIQYRDNIKFDFNNKLLLPPEILEGENWKPTAQIYSILSFFYFLLTGKPLFTDQESGKLMAKIKKIKPLKPQIINSSLSTELSDLFLDCLAKEAADRPENFRDLITQIQNLRDNNQLSSSPKEKAEIEKNQSREQNLFEFKAEGFWLLYKYGKIAAVLLVVISVLTVFVLSDGYEEIIDKETSSKKVVSYFYQSVNDKNMNLLEETIDVSKIPHIKSMVLNGYVIETAKNLFSSPPPQVKRNEKKAEGVNQEKITQEGKRLFSIENLKIKKLSNENKEKYKANYEFVFTEGNKTAKIKMNDQLLLIKVKDKWKIKKIVGDIKNREFLKKKEEKLKGK